MFCVAGIDGALGGWAAVLMGAGRLSIMKIAKVSDLIDSITGIEIVAVDIPIGFLDSYQAGGRECDRGTRRHLGRARGRSVFAAPVRCILEVLNGPTLHVEERHRQACRRSRGSAPYAKGITRQVFNIVPKIAEVDDVLHARPDLRDVIREIHPELCFSKLAGMPMRHCKSSRAGKDERRSALGRAFADLDLIEKEGRSQGLAIEDILDATVACWSARRLAIGQGRSFPEVVPFDSTALPMAIWW